MHLYGDYPINMHSFIVDKQTLHKTKLNHSCVYVSIIISPVTTLAESHHCGISLILQVVRNNLQVNSIHHLHLHIHIPTPKSLKVMQVV